MTRKRNLAAGIFAMPSAITAAVLECLTPEQRAAITPDQAGKIMQISINATTQVGNALLPDADKAGRL